MYVTLWRFSAGSRVDRDRNGTETETSLPAAGLASYRDGVWRRPGMGLGTVHDQSDRLDLGDADEPL